MSAIVADCDRLEAIGRIGIERCYQYTIHSKRPLVLPTTPLPVNECELAEVMLGRSLADYVRSNGTSASMIDHWYEKLLLLGTMSSGIPQLQVLADAKMAEMKQWLFSFNAVVRLVSRTEPVYGSDIESIAGVMFLR